MQQFSEHPTMILVRGLPGSGKSYIASALKKSLEDSLGQNTVVMLDPDAVDQNSEEYQEHVKTQTAEGVDPKLHLYRFSRGKAYKGIAENKIVMWNQPFTNLEIFNKMVTNLRLQAEEHNTQLPLLVVEVVTDPKIAKDRVLERKQAGGHGPSDATFDRFVNDYVSFAEHGYNTVTVYGHDDVDISVAAITKALQELL